MKERLFMKTAQKARVSGILFVVTLIVNTFGALGLINGLSQKRFQTCF